MNRLPLIVSALCVAGCASEGSGPDAEPLLEVFAPEGASTEEFQETAEVAAEPELEPTVVAIAEPPPVPELPPVVLPPPVLPRPQTIVATPSTHIDFSPTMEVGDEVRRNLRWSSAAQLLVEHSGREVHSSVTNAVDVTFRLVVTAEDKGSPETVEVHFEEFSRTTAGETASLVADPSAGDAWTCQLTVEPILCAVSAEETIGAPDWLTLSYRPILPSRTVEPNEEWSRRVGVSSLIGAGSDATVRAVLSTEPAYETADGTFSTARFEFDGEDVTQALGRTSPLALGGSGAFEFDLRRRRLVGFDATWSGTASGERSSGTSYTRNAEVSVRMVELAN
ncbi:MAG: hypothetical protein ACJAYU_001171 [Bradymonadia bacterium]|jgi:hypothetical protein